MSCRHSGQARAAPAALLGLLALCVHAQGSRLLLAEQEGGTGCNATTAKWNYDGCAALTTSYTWGPLATGGSPGGGAMARNPMPTPMTAAAMPAAMAAPSGGGGGMAAMESAPAGAADTLGFATGGAQDVQNFRENVEAGYLPLPTDLTFTGLAKDYYFDTYGNASTAPCADLFCPIYSVGQSPDPLVGGPDSSELYLAVGLDSGMKASDFARKRLNLVVVTDVSGSMDSPFNRYYYDDPSATPTDDEAKTKMDVAKEVLAGIVDQLKPEDQLAIVLFSDDACVPKPLGPMSCTDAAEIKSKIKRDVVATSGTNFQSGIDAGGKQLTGCRACMEASPTDVENRIIFITDAQPNAGDTSEGGLLARIKALAADGVYTTLIGVGLDFNSELVEEITRVKGANYFSVHTPGEFRRRLVDEFDYAVTPLVFDLALRVGVAGEGDASGWKILHVYGVDTPDEKALSSDGTVMKINTLFPSPKVNGSIKGGVTLLRMKRPSGANAAAPLDLTVSYVDREGQQFSSKRTVDLPKEASQADGAGPAAFYQSTGIEKAVALARYTDLLHTWLIDQWEEAQPQDPPLVIPLTYCDTFPAWYCPLPVDTWGGLSRTSDGCVLRRWLVPSGCILPPPPPIWVPTLGRWERRSQPLRVNKEAKQAIEAFLPHFKQAQESVGDATMQQEVELMEKLVAAPSA